MTDRYVTAREMMVHEQVAARGIADPRVLAAMREVPRELFLPAGRETDPATVYRDAAQPVGRGQTLSQPYIVGAMSEALRLLERSSVLEVGTGTGYQTAVLSRIAGEVWTVERDPVLAREARSRLGDLGISNVRFRIGDGTLGWDEGAPFDAILVTAGAPEVPPALPEQLAPNGRLVVPVGPRSWQRLLRFTKGTDGVVGRPEALMECRFVPLVGRAGWKSWEKSWVV